MMTMFQQAQWLKCTKCGTPAYLPPGMPAVQCAKCGERIPPEDTPEQLIAKADQHMMYGQLDHAAHLLRQAEQKKNGVALARLALIEKQRGNLPGAQELLAKALKRDPKDAYAGTLRKDWKQESQLKEKKHAEKIRTLIHNRSDPARLFVGAGVLLILVTMSTAVWANVLCLGAIIAGTAITAVFLFARGKGISEGEIEALIRDPGRIAMPLWTQQPTATLSRLRSELAELRHEREWTAAWGALAS